MQNRDNNRHSFPTLLEEIRFGSQKHTSKMIERNK
jgi:hypothetical protein